MSIQTLRDLYRHELQDLHDAEGRMVEMLPRMAEAISDPTLKKQFDTHVTRSREHRNRLERILKGVGTEPDNVTCEGMRGILREAQRVLEQEDTDDSVRDAALLAIAQKAEHYEMAAYGAVRTYARMLGEDDAREVLQRTLDEEGRADEQLTRIAQKSVNPAARA